MGRNSPEAWLNGAGGEGRATQGSASTRGQGGGYVLLKHGVQRLGPGRGNSFGGNDGETSFHCVQPMNVGKRYFRSAISVRLDTFFRRYQTKVYLNELLYHGRPPGRSALNLPKTRPPSGPGTAGSGCRAGRLLAVPQGAHPGNGLGVSSAKASERRAWP